MAKASIKCPKCGAELRSVTPKMVDDLGVCHNCKAEFPIDFAALKFRESSEVTIGIPNAVLSSIKFPDKCAHCLAKDASENVPLIRSRYLLKDLTYPFSLERIVLFVAIPTAITEFFHVRAGDSGGAAVFSFAVYYWLLSLLRWIVATSCGSVVVGEVHYCRRCFRSWNLRRDFETALLLTLWLYFATWVFCGIIGRGVNLGWMTSDTLFLVASIAAFVAVVLLFFGTMSRR
jgi:hypothetical protein